jgi:hypothetical protein
MANLKLTLFAAAALLVSGCDGRSGGDQAGSGMPDGKAEEGKLSIRGTGADLAISMPGWLVRRAQADTESEMIPPGATFSGLHVEGGRRGGVEIRFTTPELPEQVIAWYSEASREFNVEDVIREGDAHVVTGIGRRQADRFTLRLSPRAGGATDGRLVLRQSG